MNKPDVLVIGGGVIGASAAYHLAARGVKNVAVIDAGIEQGTGSSGKATGGFRCQFPTEPNIRLSLLSRQKLLAFESELGVDPGYRQHGYLFLAYDARELQALREALALQHRCGLAEARQEDAEVARVLNPALSTDGIVGATFCPTDGFIKPLNILRGYTEAARKLGARFDYGVRCTGCWIDPATGRIVQVQTTAGSYTPGNVVNAAGPWAQEVARFAGVDLPVAPLRRQVAVVRDLDLLPETMPMTIFTGDGFHLRVRDRRVLLLLPVDDPPYHSFELGVDPAWEDRVLGLARRRIVPLAGATLDRTLSWSGLYEMSPDRHVLLGPAPGVKNLFLANGSSGHGVMHSPAIGQLLAELIVDGAAKSMDIHPLRPSRFAEGAPIHATEFL
jgi:sarcosine oxidase subunit beta